MDSEQPSIGCPACGAKVPLRAGVGVAGAKVFRCPNDHEFGAQASTGQHDAAKGPTLPPADNAGEP
jgi:hypothetical protein